jgi:hypothetical protein
MMIAKFQKPLLNSEPQKKQPIELILVNAITNKSKTMLQLKIEGITTHQSEELNRFID